MRLFCFGFGYSAEALARRLSARVSALGGTRTSLAGADGPLGAKLAVFQGDGASAEVRGLLAGTTHLLVSVPPDLEGDMVLRHFRDDLAGLPELAWIGYLSTVGVYGDCGGEWVDEASATRPTSERSLRRVLAEKAWLAFGAESGRRVEVFRLSGIYGPGRSVIDNLKAGTARRIVKPGQVFNRIHVDDIARVLAAAIDQPAGHADLQRQRRRAGPAAGCRRLCRGAAGTARPARYPLRARRPQRHGGQLLGREQARQQCPHQDSARRGTRLSDLP